MLGLGLPRGALANGGQLSRRVAAPLHHIFPEPVLQGKDRRRGLEEGEGSIRRVAGLGVCMINSGW
jgi:hypothetical protein